MKPDTEVTVYFTMTREYVWSGPISDLPSGLLLTDGELDTEALTESELAALTDASDIESEDYNFGSIEEI
jgi:hypothetical protein